MRTLLLLTLVLTAGRSVAAQTALLTVEDSVYLAGFAGWDWSHVVAVTTTLALDSAMAHDYVATYFALPSLPGDSSLISGFRAVAAQVRAIPLAAQQRLSGVTWVPATVLPPDGRRHDRLDSPPMGSTDARIAAAWSRFRAAYPGSVPCQLTRVGFSADGNRAVFFVTEPDPEARGAPTMYELQRQGAKWRLVSTVATRE